VVKGILIWPGFLDGLEITTTSNGPVRLRLVNESGIQFFEQIRLYLGEDTVILVNLSTIMNIVFKEQLARRVTSGPMLLKEICHYRIQVEENNADGFLFPLAFIAESTAIEDTLSCLTPSGQSLVLPGDAEGIQLEGSPNIDDVAIRTSIELLTIEQRADPDGREVVSIEGILVTPGKIAYRNKFLSACPLKSYGILEGGGMEVH